MHNVALVVLVLLAASHAAASHVRQSSPQNSIAVDVDTTSGAYSVLIGGSVWFESGPTVVHVGDTWYSSDTHAVPGSSQLTVVKTRTSRAFDANTISLFWSGAADDPWLYETEFVMSDAEYVVFSQSLQWQSASNDSFTGVSLHNNAYVATAFPSFALSGGKAAELYHWTQADLWDMGSFAQGFDSYIGGALGGVPMTFYNTSLASAVLSPLGPRFFVSTCALQDSIADALVCGWNGMVEQLPAANELSFVLFPGFASINDTVTRWGEMMMGVYGKQRWTPYSGDLSAMFLSYWTDNGAYYYYNTEANKDYEQTILDVRAYHESLGLPVHTYQLDSWWYYKGPNGGCANYTSRPSIFPDGLPALQAKIGRPFTTHNRWWENVNRYIEMGYEFIVEGLYSLPAEQMFWDALLANASSLWNVHVYEQDWLVYQTLDMNATFTDIDVGLNWLGQMASAAQNNGVLIQYCMPLPMHLLSSVMFQAVAQIRVSGDYLHAQPWYQQWQIGYTSLYAWALGLQPFKDTFWTTSEQPGNTYNLVEANPALQLYIATLSWGPVGPGDAIGLTDVTLLMQCCNAGGRVLRADQPLVPVERSFFARFDETAPQGVLYHTYTQLGPYQVRYLLAALDEPYIVAASDIPLAHNTRYTVTEVPNGNTSLLNVFSYAYSTASSLPLSASPTNTSNGHVMNWRFIAFFPQMASGWTLIGDASKVVPLSRQRFAQLKEGKGSFQITVLGDTAENVTVTVLPPGGHHFSSVACALQQASIGFSAVLSCAAQACTCGRRAARDD